MKKNKLFKSVVMLAMLTTLMSVSPAFANEATIGEVEVSEVTANYLNQLKSQLTSAKSDLDKLTKESKSLQEAYDKLNTDSEQRKDSVKNAHDKTKIEQEKLKAVGLSEEEINKDTGKLFENTNTGNLLGNEDSTVVNYKLEAAKAKANLEKSTTDVDKAKARLDEAVAKEKGKKQEVDKIEKEYNKAVEDAKQEASQYYARISYVSGGTISDSVPNGFKLSKAIDTSGYTSATYPWGQCTWYVYNRAAQFGISFDPYMGNGGDWRFKAGYTISNKPEIGDAVSFAPGQAGGAEYYGHVAFVEDVRPDGSILISESNFKGLGVVSYRVFDGVTASHFSYVKGHR